LSTNTIAALEKLRQANLLAADDAQVLIASAHLQDALTQVLRIALDETPVMEEATPGLKALLSRAAGTGGFTETQRRLEEMQDKTRAIFERLMN
jgi:glutamate-ammonia-ligase adenylyltransferase